MSKVIRCRTISEGYGEGEAIVSRQALGFNHGVDLETGRIKEIGHELEGQSIKGKVFLFPRAKETIVAVGAILCGLPVVDCLEEDPFENIEDGDYVKVDATNGTVEIIKKGEWNACT